MRSGDEKEGESGRSRMLQDVVDLPEQLPTEEGISSPIAAQILSFCDEGDLFSETLRNSEVSSCSGGGGSGSGSAGAGSVGGDICCYDDGSLPSEFPPFSSIDPSALSAILDPQTQPEPGPDVILASSYPPLQRAPLPPRALFPSQSYLSNPQGHFDPSSMAEIAAPIGSYSSYPDSILPLSGVPLPLGPTCLPSVFDDDGGLLPLSGYMGLDSSPASTSCSFIDTSIGGAFYPGSIGVDRPAFYPQGIVASQQLGQEAVVEYQGETVGGCGGMGFYVPDGTPNQRIFCSPGESQQKLFGDSHPLVGGCASPTPLASDMASLNESSFKVGRLSIEERQEKINRYMKKRNERNFSKKIKYACRKTLADSRPRVRGRFAKNDEFGEATKAGSSNQEEDDEEEAAMKEEYDTMDSSELFAHLGGMNSFKCNYTLESWI